jgi:hypothetical protein
MLVLLCEVSPRLSAKLSKAVKVGNVALRIPCPGSPVLQVLSRTEEVGKRTDVGSEVVALGRRYPAAKRGIRRRFTVIDVHEE